nr:MAG TPA: tail tape measure protein [Caudoviricetes sp.]
MAENEQFFRIVVDYQSGLDALKKVEDALKDVKDRQKELIDEMKKGTISQEEYGTKMQDLTVKIKLYTDQRRQAIKAVKTITELNNAEEGSLVRLSAEYGRLLDVYRNMSREDRNGKQGQVLIKQLKDLNDELATAEAAVGRYGRNVGNYASAFTPLQFQVQQLARELPSLTVSAQQFFLAISNNLPMLVDEMQRARVANEALKKAGETTVPVWKQMLKSIGSWQTMLVVGITLLTAYGKEIGQWVKELFKGKKAIDEVAIAMEIANEKGEAYKDAFKSASSTYGQNLVLLNQLQDKWNQLGDDLNAKKRFIDENKTSFSNLGVSVTSVKDAENLFVGNTATFVEAMKIRAQAIASQSTLAELYAKQLQASTEAERLGIMAEWRKNNVTQNDRDEALRRNAWLNTEGAEVYGRYASVNPATIAAEQAEKFTEYQKEQLAKAQQYDTQINLVYKQMATSYKQLEAKMKAGGFKPNAGSGSSGKTENAYKKIAFEELKAAQELALSEQNYAARMNEAILNDENQSYENRMAALEQFTSNKQNVILQGADDEIENLIRSKAKELNLDADNKNDRVKIEKICANQIGVIRDEANTKVLELEETKNKKEIELRDKAAGDMIALMADGSAKEMAKLNLLYNQKVRAAQGNAEKLLAIQKWYEREAAKITPEGKLASGMSEANRTYEMQMDLIDQMEIKEEEKDKKRIEAELTFRKAQAKTFEDYIKGLQTTGQLSEGEYQEMISELGGMYTDIANLQNQLDGTASEGKGSNFIQKLFGIDTSTKKGKAEWKAKKKEMISQVTDFAKELTSSVIDIQKEASQRRLKLEQERIDAERDSELKSLELRYNKGLMSEKAYNKAVDATNAEADRKKEEAERAAFERDKQLKIKQVMIETALSIAKTFAMYGWPLGIVPAAFAAAEGAVQVAVISAQQYAKGGIIPIGDGKNGVSMGMLQGPSHSQGGIPLMVNGQPVNAEVEGGEILAVINKRSAAQYLPLFSAINATNGVKFENGGVVGSGWSLPTPAPRPMSGEQFIAARIESAIKNMDINFNNGIIRLAKAQSERVDNIKVYVSEKDITKTQKKVASIRAKATIIGGK